jgi:DNA-binding transcriptional regulator PaaX
MTPSRPAWLLLVTNLPGQNKTLRMRIWRAIKAAGAGMLRDGVYVLPQSAA